MSCASNFDVPDRSEQAPTVLIIEDAPANRKAMVMLLREAQFQCVSANDSDEGWRLIQSGAISLVVIDLDPNTLTFIERMRANPFTSDIPIIIASGERRKEVRQAMMDAGAAMYLTKPYRSAELLDNVRQCLADGQA